MIEAWADAVGHDINIHLSPGDIVEALIRIACPGEMNSAAGWPVRRIVIIAHASLMQCHIGFHEVDVGVGVEPLGTGFGRDAAVLAGYASEDLAGHVLVEIRPGLPGMAFDLGRILSEHHIDLTITAVSSDSITVDGNHPLAGKALNFDIELVDIARAS